MPTTARSRRAHALIALSTCFVATTFPAVASIAGELPSVVLAVLRFIVASLVFLPIVVLRNGRDLLPGGRAVARYALLSAPLVGFFAAMFEALRTTTPVNTAAIFTLAPIFAALYAFFLLGERPGPRRVTALLVGMVGALWVITRGEPSRLVELDFVVGDAWFLAGTASLGLYMVLVKRLHRGEPSEVMTFWTLVTGAFWLLLFSGKDLVTIDWPEVPQRVYLVVAYLAIFATLVTFYLTQYAATVIGPTRTMAYSYWNPALVALLAWWTTGTPLELRAWPGVALTLLAMNELRRAAPTNGSASAGDATDADSSAGSA